jgi:hypothetical protein
MDDSWRDPTSATCHAPEEWRSQEARLPYRKLNSVADIDSLQTEAGQSSSCRRSPNSCRDHLIDLAKSDSRLLPYGLHGTSIPDQMNALESIGGLALQLGHRRAVRQDCPLARRPLEWRQ